jgi:hypothetical protein
MQAIRKGDGYSKKFEILLACCCTLLPCAIAKIILYDCSVFLFTWPIIVGSGLDESIYWTLTGRNYN